MFCCHCGTQLGDRAGICPSCREAANPLTAYAQTPGIPLKGLPTDPVAWLRAQRPELVGVSGWLFLFCVGHAILAPLFLAATYSRSRPGGEIYIVALAVADCFTGIWLWLKKPNALTLVKVLLITVIALNAFGVYRTVTRGMNAAISNPDDLSGIKYMWSLCVSLGWFLYFRYSKRVLATFGENI